MDPSSRPLCYRPASAASLRFAVLLHLHLSKEKVTLATWPAIWRGAGGYPAQAKHNPITPQGGRHGAFAELCLSDILFLVGRFQKIQLRVYGQERRTRINRCFYQVQTSQVHCEDEYDSAQAAGANNKRVRRVHSFVNDQVESDGRPPRLRRHWAGLHLHKHKLGCRGNWQQGGRRSSLVGWLG